MLFRPFAVSWMMVLGAAGPLRAQGLGHGITAAPGEQIRFWLADGRREQGRLTEALTDDARAIVYCPRSVASCLADEPGSVIRRQLSEIGRIERRTGDHAVRGALIGAGIALGIVLLGEAVESRDSPLEVGPPRVVSIAGLIGLGVSLGAVIGSSSEQWEQIR